MHSRTAARTVDPFRGRNSLVIRSLLGCLLSVAFCAARAQPDSFHQTFTLRASGLPAASLDGRFFEDVKLLPQHNPRPPSASSRTSSARPASHHA